jgi:hypothetical protein
MNKLCGGEEEREGGGRYEMEEITSGTANDILCSLPWVWY